jgi:hypothetical protein
MYEDAIGEAWPWTDGPLLLLPTNWIIYSRQGSMHAAIVQQSAIDADASSADPTYSTTAVHVVIDTHRDFLLPAAAV